MNGSCVIAALSQRISQSGQDARMGGTDPVALFLCFRSEWPHSSSSSELEVKPQRKATMKTEDDPLLSIGDVAQRSEEHTSELQSPCNLVCRLLLEKKKVLSTITLTIRCV